MNISINFPAEIERQLRQRAAAAGQDVESFVLKIVIEWLAQEDKPKRPRKRSREEFKKRLRKIVELHPGSGGKMDDSRESIYAGRGE